MTELRERIQKVIENEPVALFMKGTPQFVMCGNSDRALRAQRLEGMEIEMTRPPLAEIGRSLRLPAGGEEHSMLRLIPLDTRLVH